MNKLIIACLLLIGSAGFSFAGKEKTIENLKAAVKGETTASEKYAGYAGQAKKEGFIQIEAMFSAASKSEAIHAANHKSVLVKMGQKIDSFKPEFDVKTTKENITDAIKGESYEISTMYPGFISTAKMESENDAIKSFRWAMETEKKHQQIYQSALNALNAGTAVKLPKVYWVCPKCGNTYDVSKPESSCSFCSTSSDRFLKFIDR